MKRTERKELNLLIRETKQLFEDRPEIKKLKARGEKNIIQVYPMDVHWGVEVHVGTYIDGEDLRIILQLSGKYGLKEVAVYAGYGDEEGDVIIQMARPYDHTGKGT